MADRDGLEAGEALDLVTRAHHEARLGIDLGAVRLFRGADAERVARGRGAEALTIGKSGAVLLGGSPERSAETAAGRALLAHELTHVAQAARGAAGVALGDEQEAEAEAAERAEAGAGDDGEGDDDGGAAAAALEAAVRERVLELLAEDLRIGAARGGRTAR